MKKHEYLVTFSIISIIALSGFVVVASRAQNNVNNIEQTEKIKMATCPTYYNIATSLPALEYEVVRTNSTAESVGLLGNGLVDYVLSGRQLKPNEGYFEREFISKEGYSFVSTKDKIVNINNLEDEIVCTDLDKEIVETDLNLKNITQIQEISECESGSIIITSWDNTDYNKFKVVHVVNSDGSRHVLSRTPILYCRDKCPQNIINQLKKIYEK